MTLRKNYETYNPDLVQTAGAVAKFGATDAEIADVLGIAQRTLVDWMAKHPEFAAVIKAGKDEADARVERALYQRAIGYSYDAQEWFVVNKALEEKWTRKHVPPDVTACIFWLKNRQRRQWRENGNLANEVNGQPTLATVEAHLFTKIFGIIERRSNTPSEIRQIEKRGSGQTGSGGSTPA